MYSATISGYVVMIHSCSCRFPVDIAAQVSTLQMNVTSVSSVVPNLISMPGNPLFMADVILIFCMCANVVIDDGSTFKDHFILM